MNCIRCNHPGAYVGFTAAECANPRCVLYTARAYMDAHISAPMPYVGIDASADDDDNDPNTWVRLYFTP